MWRAWTSAALLWPARCMPTGRWLCRKNSAEESRHKRDPIHLLLHLVCSPSCCVYPFVGRLPGEFLVVGHGQIKSVRVNTGRRRPHVSQGHSLFAYVVTQRRTQNASNVACVL